MRIRRFHWLITWVVGFVVVVGPECLAQEAPAASESLLSYEVTALDSGGARQAPAVGVVNTGLQPGIEVLLSGPGAILWSRNLALSDGFSLSARFVDYLPTSGNLPALVFAVRNSEHPQGRSRHGSLQLGEGGTFVGTPGQAQLVLSETRDVATVRFLEDVVLPYTRDLRDKGFSHEIMIRAGSELHLVHGTDLTEVGSR